MELGELSTIKDVTQMLSDLLGQVNDSSVTEKLEVSLHSPATLPTSASMSEGSSAVNLYLYRVCENEHAKNRPWVTQPSGEQEYPPLALTLYYLVTPYASDPLSAHQALTHAMYLLYTNSMLKGADLPDSLRLTVENLTVNLCQMSLEELTRIWNAMQTPYRLSVSYEVRVVLIESKLRVRPSRVEVAEFVHDQT